MVCHSMSSPLLFLLPVCMVQAVECGLSIMTSPVIKHVPLVVWAVHIN